MKTMKILVVVLAFSTIMGTARAEDSATAEQSDDRAAGKTDVESAIAQDATKLSADEKKRRTESMLKEMRDTLKRAIEMLAEARASKDIVMLNCVNDKLTQIKGLLKISEQASVKMYEAIAAGQEDATNHMYTKMAVAHQHVLVLRATAESCVGEASIYTGETEVEVEVSESLSGDCDPTVSPNWRPGWPWGWDGEWAHTHSCGGDGGIWSTGSSGLWKSNDSDIFSFGLSIGWYAAVETRNDFAVRRRGPMIGIELLEWNPGGSILWPTIAFQFEIVPVNHEASAFRFSDGVKDVGITTTLVGGRLAAYIDTGLNIGVYVRGLVALHPTLGDMGTNTGMGAILQLFPRELGKEPFWKGFGLEFTIGAANENNEKGYWYAPRRVKVEPTLRHLLDMGISLRWEHDL